MATWKPTRLEWIVLAGFAVFWTIVLAILPPNPGGTDVYLFRDAAWNLIHGQGFRTASFEHSHSFSPLLYSNYTPGSLWVYAAAARLLGAGAPGQRLYPHLLAAIADAIVLFAGLRFLVGRWLRWSFLLLMGALLPFSVLGPLGDRPEAVSFPVLVLLAAAMRRKLSVSSTAIAGLIGGAAFLCQPFAGVVAVLSIAGWLLLSEPFAGRFARFTAQSVTAAMMFALPIVVTALVFYQKDAQSLERFWRQATVAGVSRQTNYQAGESAGASTDIQPGATSSTGSVSPSRLQKYKEAWAFQRALGPVTLATYAGAVVISLAWLLMLATSQGSIRGRLALALAGFACFVFPVVVFPLQGNYLAITRVLFPVLLALDWASVRGALRSTVAIPVLLMISAVAVLPASGVAIVSAWETRGSYSLALQQVEQLGKHLQQHPLKGKVVLVPAGQYYLYKKAAGDIYNPGYLSYQEDPAQVAAVVNCYRGTTYFAPGSLPLPTFVSQRSWKRLSTAADAVEITLFGYKVMSRNWGLGCDIYVEPSH